MMGRPFFASADPRIKSACPPIPEKNWWPMESAHTWPVRSISNAELIATMLSLRDTFLGSET
jgi:hypothetical protein